MSALLVLRQAAVVGRADSRLIYTLKTWSTGWMARVLAQVAFFAMIGRLIDDETHTHYLLIGSAVFIATMETMMAVASTTWERMQTGTLPLLVAAPGSMAAVFLGRSWYWVASGTMSASLSLLILAPAFGVPMPLPQAVLAVPLIGVVAVATYGVALTLGGLALRFIDLRNVISNIAHLSMMALCGVLVPTSYWSDGLAGFAQVLPLTHGLGAVRDLLDGAAAGDILGQAGWALVVGAGWMLAAVLTFRRLAEGGRKAGTIEFGG